MGKTLVTLLTSAAILITSPAFALNRALATDSSPNHIHGKLAGDARLVEAELPDPGELIMPSVLTGVVVDESGGPIPNASVRLERNETEIARVEADTSGKYRITVVDHARGLYDLSALKNDLGTWRTGIRLVSGEEQTVNLTLKSAISISGTILMLDGVTPHVAVPVEAIRSGRKVAGTLTDERGKYRFVNLKPGQYQVRCQVLGGYVFYGEEKAGVPISLQIQPDKPLRNADLHIAAFKKGIFRTYNRIDGLSHHTVQDIYCDSEGVMWFGTRVGISRYDGQRFVNLTTEDGLAHNEVHVIHGKPDGTIWIGTKGGISRYDGRSFTNFTTKDGLAHNYVTAIHRDSRGYLWFGTGWFDLYGAGVSRYDGREFTNLTAEDGLAYNTVLSIDETPDGILWFGTAHGISPYDGTEFDAPIYIGDGIERNVVTDICVASDGTIWLGTLDGLCRYDGKEFRFLTTEDGLPHNVVRDITEDSAGVLWLATGEWAKSGGGVSRFDGETFVNFTVEDGLGSNVVFAVEHAPDGTLWFGFNAGGVSHYDSSGILNFSAKDGMADNWVNTIHIDTDSTIWFGLKGGGLSRYDGHGFHSYTIGSGLMTDAVYDIHPAPDRKLWIGTWDSGAFLYNGGDFVSVPALSKLMIMSIYSDSEGATWFGTWQAGVFRYDDGQLTAFTTQDGLAGNIVGFIEQDTRGNLWFGTRDGGLSRYDGERFENFSVEDGLGDNWVTDIYSAPDGTMWFGTLAGVSRYDGRALSNFSMADGLPGSDIGLIYGTSDGDMWFGSSGRGAFRYDGYAWTSLDTRDGLAGNGISDIVEDADGYLWIGTTEGVTRYQPVTTRPKVRIISANSDMRYDKPDSTLRFRKGERVNISYSSIDFRTIPEKRQYRYRIFETRDLRHETSDVRLETVESRSPRRDVPYNPPTKQADFDWIPEKSGKYTFEVQAIDRDLNYSEPASVSIIISPPPFYRTGIFTVLVSIMGSASLLAAIILGTQRWRLAHNEKLRLQNELQDAREMQIALLPEAAPPVEGMEIAGRCITANTVGGDFFDYLELANGRIGIAIADVSGKGLRAAMNATMANGMMHEVATTIEASCGRILSRLNAHLYPLMEKQMFTAFSLAILDQDAGVIQWSSAGQPLPMIKRSDRASEADGGGELPLGMAPDVTYPDHEFKLQTGDIVIFYTDGIIEAENEAEEMYGTERLLDLASGIDSSASAEDVIESILHDVTRFVGAAQQYDDMTIVVVKRI